MKGLGVFIIIAILSSYVPMISMDGCPEENHMGNKQMDCGSFFHCPIVVNFTISEISSLPFNGRLVSAPFSLRVDELPYFIFHPPKHQISNLFDGDGRIMKFWHKDCL